MNQRKKILSESFDDDTFAYDFQNLYYDSKLELQVF